MHLNHTGIFSNSEEQADRFYSDFLGLHKTKDAILAVELSEQIFSVPREIKMMVFEKEGLKIEVFICPECKQPSPDFRHMGLYVHDLQKTLDKAKKFNVDHIIAQKGGKTVHFLKDFSGNLIEIKEI